MIDKKKVLLKERLQLLDKSTEVLQYSYQRCIKIKDNSQFSDLELERFESLTGHFARLAVF